MLYEYNYTVCPRSEIYLLLEHTKCLRFALLMLDRTKRPRTEFSISLILGKNYL